MNEFMSVGGLQRIGKSQAVRTHLRFWVGLELKKIGRMIGTWVEMKIKINTPTDLYTYTYVHKTGSIYPWPDLSYKVKYLPEIITIMFNLCYSWSALNYVHWQGGRLGWKINIYTCQFYSKK